MICFREVNGVCMLSESLLQYTNGVGSNSVEKRKKMSAKNRTLNTVGLNVQIFMHVYPVCRHAYRLYHMVNVLIYHTAYK